MRAKDKEVIQYQRHQMFTQEWSTGDPKQHSQVQLRNAAHSIVPALAPKQ